MSAYYESRFALAVLAGLKKLAHACRMDEFARMLFVQVLRLRYASLRMTGFWLVWNPSVKGGG